MTPRQKIRQNVLMLARLSHVPLTHPIRVPVQFNDEITVDNVDELYEAVTAEHGQGWDQEFLLQVESCQTGLEAPHVPGYESRAVAARMPDGSWVGWSQLCRPGTVRGTVETVQLVDDAYVVHCSEVLEVRKIFTMHPVATPGYRAFGARPVRGASVLSFLSRLVASLDPDMLVELLRSAGVDPELVDGVGKDVEDLGGRLDPASCEIFERLRHAASST